MLNRLLIVTIVGGLLPLGGELWWLLELFSHFRLQYVALALLLLLVAIRGRRYRLALLLAATAGINLWPVWPYLSSARPPLTGGSFTLLNLNVKASNPERERILALLSAADADIVTLIELSPQLAELLPTLASRYPYQITEPGAGNFGLGVLSRYPLLAANAFKLGPTTAIEAGVALPAGELRLIAVHPVPPISATMAATRNQQLGQLAVRARQADEPLLICGDFNLSPYSPYFQRFLTESATTDTRRGLGIGFSWPTFLPLLGIPIDHCFTRGALVATEVERMDPIGSDHYPVRLTLRWLDNQ
jgi:endonuclease/exonuclease/phosphatase (EEP) superfamily protein YafD